MSDVNQLSAYDYFLAYSISQPNSWKEITTTDYVVDDQEQITLESCSPDSENILLKKEEFNNLSEDAKEIILTILDSSIEILELYSPKYRKTNRNKIASYFRKKWGARNRVKKAIQEISEFVHNFE